MGSGKDGSDEFAYAASGGRALFTTLSQNAIAKWGFQGQAPKNFRFRWNGSDLWGDASVVTGPDGTPATVSRLNTGTETGGSLVPSLQVASLNELWNTATDTTEFAQAGPQSLSSVSISSATTTSIIPAAGSGLKNRIWRVIIQQNGAAATGGTWTLGDNSTAFNNIFPANNAPSGTAAIEAGAVTFDLGPNGILQPTANSAIETVTSSTLNCTIWILFSVD